MTARTRLDLQQIEASLLGVQRGMDRLNALTGTVRDPIEGDMIGNMLMGYQCVERFVNDGIDLFAMGESKCLLELNHIVLLGADKRCRSEHAGHLEATERRFYEEPNAGIEDLSGWYHQSTKTIVWDLAAGVYVRILTKPQLYIEGNHRTGALVMSYVLMRCGQPPFVLTRDNAAGYFGPSSAIRDIRKNSFAAYFQLRGIRRRISAYLRQESNTQYLQPAGPVACAVTSGGTGA